MYSTGGVLLPWPLHSAIHPRRISAALFAQEIPTSCSSWWLVGEAWSVRYAVRLLTDPSHQFYPSSNARAQDSRLCLELKGPRRSNTVSVTWCNGECTRSSQPSSPCLLSLYYKCPMAETEPRGRFCQFLKCDRRLTSEPAHSLPIPRLCSSL
ncbi:hypothetical protein VNO77_19939 [Canavalia gladiata]|uniref:Uncharacterized protein n=1 Tax=Canavalia gladiata TaxID=3824 RepID=A0AAN9LNJ5_CANGL